jgi:transcriptional regulator with XRE-family HTH domain
MTALGRMLDQLNSQGGLQGKDIANIADVSPATVSRWANGKGTPSIGTQTLIADLRYVVELLSDLYTPEETRLWLHARHPLLNNERAIDLIIQDKTQEVIAVIERLNAIAYL